MDTGTYSNAGNTNIQSETNSKIIHSCVQATGKAETIDVLSIHTQISGSYFSEHHVWRHLPFA